MELGFEARIAPEVDVEAIDAVEADDAVELFFLLKLLDEAFDVFDGLVIGGGMEINAFDFEGFVWGAFPVAGKNGDAVACVGASTGEAVHVALETAERKIFFDNES